ncbi:MAG: DUF559 domain-containing protein [Chloroflexi bacterium]|nr:MAG: DUF559 domain-containing protein [Chloroflexota bacterium]
MRSPRTASSRRLRRSMSGAELRIWVRLRGRRLDGWKFRRQQPIGEYYVDFYCAAAKLVVEIDGPSHQDERAAYDVRRQAFLEAEGYKVIRFSVSGIDEEIVDVMDSIRVQLEEREKLGFTRRYVGVQISPSGGSADTSHKWGGHNSPEAGGATYLWLLGV